MKLFITLAVVCVIASVLAAPFELSEEQKSIAKQYSQECNKQENISDEDANKLHQKDFANPSQNMKCFSACFFEKAGILKDSKVQEDAVLAKLGSIFGEEKTKTILAKCKDVKGADRCDSGFKLYQCFESAKAEVAA